MAGTKAGSKGQEKEKVAKRTLSITVTEDTAERFTVYCRRRRKPLGVIAEPWLRRIVKGMVMPSMPNETDEETVTAEVPPGGTGEIGGSGAVETAGETEAVTSSDKPPLVIASGAEEGGRAPLPPGKLSNAEAARLAAKAKANRPAASKAS